MKEAAGAGVLGPTKETNLAGIFLEPVSITAESIRTDVRNAVASAAIDTAGVGSALLAELNAAAAAHASGECGVAANLYNAFIADLTAQSGKHVAAATATQLIGEAQFLIANCP